MNKTPNYLIITILLAAVLLLAACGGETAVSAAENDPIAVEEMVETAELVETDIIQETPLEDEPINDQSNTPPQAAPANGAGPSANGAGPGSGDHITPEGELNQAEIDALLYMREEEKLARDVYLTMYALWGSPIFDNIASSEQAHMDAIAYLLQAYGLTDPVTDDTVGKFTNTYLQGLYNDLIAQGQKSLEDALLVGAAIEEIDIKDLQEALAVTENAAVAQTFENLLAGSVNHLRAFVTNLERQTGTIYTPKHLEPAAYEALLGTTSGQGNGQGQGSGGGQGSGSSGGGRAQGGGNGQGQGSGSSQGQGNGNGRGRSS